MNDPRLLFDSMMYAIVGTLGRVVPTTEGSDGGDRDRGAVSIETVLWYAAAAVSVAVIAAIVWGQIRDTANTGVDQPSAP